jgi:hypothetical protein
MRKILGLVWSGFLACLATWSFPSIAQGICDATRVRQVPPLGVSMSAVVQRATYKTTAPNCQLCPGGSETRQNPLDCTCYLTTIPQLKNVGLDKDIRFNIRYAALDSVGPSSAQNLVVAFAGQNGSSAGSVSGGGPSNLTGQPDHWQDSCDDRGCGIKSFNPGGLTERLVSLLGPPNTHAVVFVDHQYDWGRWYDENEKIANGITDYLKTLITPSVVKSIVVTGHSRGGCLTLTVARKLRADATLRNIRLFVLPLDAVCNPDKPGEENWTTSATTDDNPLIVDTSYFGWRSTYPTNAGLGGDVCVANIVGGETFSPLLVHGLSFGPDTTGNLHQFNNWWSFYQHVPLGVSYDPGAIMDGVGSFYYFVRNNVMGAPACGPANCNGCCDASGTCVPGNATQACGVGGSRCVFCQPPTNAYPICTTGKCTWKCTTGYHDCGDGKCIKTPCP